LLCGFGYSQAQAPGCPQVTCVMFCANGVKKDANGCNTCSCATVPGQAVGSFDCSQAPGWGWCAAFSQCVNPAVTACPGGITGTPGAGSGGAVGRMPNPSVQPSVQFGASISANLASLPSQWGAADVHGCPPSFPWCDSQQSCAAPTACGAAPFSFGTATSSFATPSFGSRVPASSYATPSFQSALSVPKPVKPANCDKKSCKACRAHLGCNWHTTGQCLPYCRPDGTCISVGATCPAKPKKVKIAPQAN